MTPGADGEPLRVAAARFLATGVLDRSAALRRLFEYLLVQTLAGKTTREIDLAQDVFGRPGQQDFGQDASVRVHVHRLRRRLEEYRLSHQTEALFLTIPRGEYGLALKPMAEAAPDEDLETETTIEEPPKRSAWRWWGLAFGALLIANVVAWVIVGYRSEPLAAVAAARSTPFWSDFLNSTAPTVIVVGDYYIFGQADGASTVARLVREFSINSHEDLDSFLMQHPDQEGRMVDLDLYYLPTGAAPALLSLSPLINELGRHGAVRVISMSELTPDVLRNANVIYVGFLSGLGMLRSIVFDASSLRVGSSYDELIDSRTGKRFISDWGELAEGGMPKQDYGYLASFALPGGKRLAIIAGTRDAALTQSAEAAIDPTQLKDIAHRTDGAASTEALLSVDTMGNAALAAKLVLARPMAPAGLPTAGARPNFPDQTSRKK